MAECTFCTFMSATPSQTSQHQPSSSPPIPTRPRPNPHQRTTTIHIDTPRHFGLTHRYLGPLHAPSLCGTWHNEANHFVVFYLCPEFWTMIDPLNNFPNPSFTMSTNIAIALDTTYLHHNRPVPPLPPFWRVNRIAMQADSPFAPWSCGTIAMLTTLHLTLGHIRPDNINTASISRRQYLTFHQSLLHWLILGTPPDLWTMPCLRPPTTQSTFGKSKTQSHS